MLKRYSFSWLFVSLLLTATLIGGCGSQSSGAGGNGAGTGATEDGGDNGGGDETPGPGTVGSASCAELYANYPLTLVSGTTTHNEAWPAVAKPVRGVAMREETYGTCRVRATDHAADGTTTFARNDYSRRQAFNADSTLFLVNDHNGSWWVYDAQTFTKVKELAQLGGDAEAQWHPTDPDVLYYLPTNGFGMKIYRLTVSTGQSVTVADLAARLQSIWPTAAAAWTKSEGSPSANGRYWALQVDSGSWSGLGIVTYDLQTDTILASYDFAAHGKGRPDHLSMSPTGDYVVVSWDEGPVVFNRDLTNARLLASAGEHSDIALDANGNDVYVSVDYGDGYVYMKDLATLTRTDLFPTYLNGSATAMHFSGKAYAHPGWALISTYGEYGPKQWLHRKVFAVRLAANPTVYHLAHTHEIYNDYFSEPHASVNRDFTKILFNSNWDTDTASDIDAYLIELPAGAVQ